MPLDSRHVTMRLSFFVLSCLWLLTATGGCTARSDTGMLATEGTSFAISDRQVAADGVAEAVIDIWVRDGDGNPQVGWQALLASEDMADMQQPVARTDLQGHTRAAIRRATPGNVAFTLVAGPGPRHVSAPGMGKVRFFATENSRGNKLAVKLPPVASVDDVTAQQVVLAVTDALGEPVAGVTVSLHSDQPADSFGVHTGQTDAQGQLIVDYKSTIAGLKNLTASIKGAAPQPAIIQFLAGAPDADHIVFDNAGSGITADGITDNQVRVFVGDRFGNPVPNIPVAVASMGSAIAAMPPSGSSDATGFFRTTLTSSTVGSAQLTVEVASHTQDHGVTLVPGGVSKDTSLLWAKPQTLLSYDRNKSLLVATLSDAAHHPLANQQVSWRSDDARDVFDADTSVSDANGMVQTCLSSSFAHNANVVAKVGQVALATQVAFIDDRPSATLSQLKVIPTVLTAGDPNGFFVQAQLQNSNDTPAAGFNLTWSTSQGTGILSPASSVSDANGQTTTQLLLNQSGTTAITATFPNGSVSFPVTVMPGPPDASQSQLTVASGPPIADGHSTLPISGRFVDAYGNPLANQTVSLSTEATRWVSLRYAAGEGKNLQWGGIAMNQQNLPPWSILSSNGWDNWTETERFPLPLQNANNLFSATATTAPPSNWDALRLWQHNHPMILQGEDADMAGGTTNEHDHEGFSGLGFADFHGIAGASLTFSFFAAPGDLNRSLSLRYAANLVPPGFEMILNGQTLNRPFADKTDAWTNWYITAPLDVTLNPGSNTLTVVNRGEPIIVDYLMLQNNDDAQNLQCETGLLSGTSVRVDQEHPGYQGAGFLSYFLVGSKLQMAFPGTGDVFVNTEAVTDPLGFFSSELSATHAEAKIISATLSDCTQQVAATFTAGPVDQQMSSLTPAADSTTVNQPLLFGIKALSTTLDPMPLLPVEFKAAPSCTIAPASSIVTDERGVGSSSITCSQTGDVELCASFNGVFTQCQIVHITAPT